MCPCIKASVWLCGVLAAACTATAATTSDLSTTTVWEAGVLNVAGADAAWSTPVPGKALSTDQHLRKRFGKSTVTVHQQMQPDGLVRMAQANYQGRTWLQWGHSTSPVQISPLGLRLIERLADGDAATGTTWEWSTPNLQLRRPATAGKMQRIASKGNLKGNWCLGFSLQAAPTSPSHTVDGTSALVLWMGWRMDSARRTCN